MSGKLRRIVDGKHAVMRLPKVINGTINHKLNKLIDHSKILFGIMTMNFRRLLYFPDKLPRIEWNSRECSFTNIVQLYDTSISF